MKRSRDTVNTGNPKTTARGARANSAHAVLIAAWVLAALGNPISASAQVDDSQEPEREAEAPIAQPSAVPPKVDLGRLLRLPDSYQQPTGRRRGVNRSEWETRFETVRLDLSSAEQALAKAQSDLSAAADQSSSWSVAAPGAAPSPENTPLSYKLRQEIRRQRESIERAEHKLLALEIEADIADVPEQWRASNIGGEPAQ